MNTLSTSSGKTLGIMQPYVFPYIGYFQLVHAVDEFVFYDDVNFIKRGWINRNKLHTGIFSVPLCKVSQNRLISETLIHDSYLKWKAKFIKTLRYYAKRPNYAKIRSLVVSILDEFGPGDSIAYLALRSVAAVSGYLELGTEFNRSSNLANQHLRGQDRILDICKQRGASAYINAAGGRHLYSEEKFTQQGIQLRFIKTRIPPAGEAFDFLSIISMLMSCDKLELRNYVTSYSLEGPDV